MRTIGILTLFTLLCGNIMSQDADICNDLFISEILYGYHEDSVATVNTYETKSYALEIFNPTDNSISLSDYKIELVDNDDQVANTTFNLSGTIDSAETFVIANTDADVAVTSKADFTHDDFKFDSFVQVQLTKNSTILDELGERGVSDPDTIEIDSILTNSDYLSEVNIDLSSVHNLIMRRNILIKTGDSSFSSEEVLDQWTFYPDELVEGLGQHDCSCLALRIWWEPTSDVKKEAIEIIQESDYTDNYHEYTLVVDGSSNDNVDVWIDPYQSTNQNNWSSANIFIDFESKYDYSAQEYYTISPGTYHQTEFDVETIKTYQDGIKEGIEGAGIALLESGGNYFVFQPDLLELGIKDNTSSGISTENLEKHFEIYPKIFENGFYINILNKNDLNVQSIKIYETNGNVLLKRSVNLKESKVFIQMENQVSGYRIIQIKTNQGTFTTKALQVNK